MFSFAPDVVRGALADRPQLARAAMTALRGAFVEGRGADVPDLAPLLEGAAMVLGAAGGHAQACLEIAFQTSRPAEFRTLAPLLRIVIDDDEEFERAVIAALGSDDEHVAANALAIQYAAWGFPDRFRLSARGHAAITAAVAHLEARAQTSPTIAAALASYAPPPIRR